MKRIFLIILLASMLTGATDAQTFGVATENANVSRSGDMIYLNADLNLDKLNLKSDRQLFITPIVKGESIQEVIVLPSILVNGRNMHYAWQRGSLKDFDDVKNRDILVEVRRDNGRPQSVAYQSSFKVADWMRTGNAHVEFTYDSCGCGVDIASRIGEMIPLQLNPHKLW